MPLNLFVPLIMIPFRTEMRNKFSLRDLDMCLMDLLMLFFVLINTRLSQSESAVALPHVSSPWDYDVARSISFSISLEREVSR